MKVRHFLLALAVTTFFFVPPAMAQEKSTEKLGKAHFPISCNSEAQQRFDRAVPLLHSFWFDAAINGFGEVVQADPNCAMPYWGAAMALLSNPFAWPPPAKALSEGSAAVEKAKSIGAKTQRERDYIAAIEVFYKDADKLDHRKRTLAYSEAMEQLYRRNPSDLEAGVFYALTLVSTGMMSNDKSYANEKKAAQILNRVLAREPQHPGVTHYLIHSYDYPALAHLALPAARSYAKIAPASAHAQHMPSHIFTRLGLWQEGIQSNLTAETSAKAFAVRNHLSGAWDEQF